MQQISADGGIVLFVRELSVLPFIPGGLPPKFGFPPFSPTFLSSSITDARRFFIEIYCE